MIYFFRIRNLVGDLFNVRILSRSMSIFAACLLLLQCFVGYNIMQIIAYGICFEQLFFGVGGSSHSDAVFRRLYVGNTSSYVAKFRPEDRTSCHDLGPFNLLIHRFLLRADRANFCQICDISWFERLQQGQTSKGNVRNAYYLFPCPLHWLYDICRLDILRKRSLWSLWDYFISYTSIRRRIQKMVWK